MSVYDDVLDAIIALADDALPYAPILVGPLPLENGLSIAWSSGAPETTFWGKSSVVSMTAVLNGKHSDQRTVSDTLARIHYVLTRRKTYWQTAEWQIADIATIGAPIYIGRENNNTQWLYGSSLRVKIYVR